MTEQLKFDMFPLKDGWVDIGYDYEYEEYIDVDKDSFPCVRCGEKISSRNTTLWIDGDTHGNTFWLECSRCKKVHCATQQYIFVITSGKEYA
jgi:hypothetical protein